MGSQGLFLYCKLPSEGNQNACLTFQEFSHHLSLYSLCGLHDGEELVNFRLEVLILFVWLFVFTRSWTPNLPPPAITPACLAPLIVTPVSSLICNDPAPSHDGIGRQPMKLHQGKAVWRGGISPRVLKTCATHLSGILQHIVNLSQMQEPVPTEATSSSLSDFSPVALMSHVMKVRERLVVVHFELLRTTGETCSWPTPICLPVLSGCGWWCYLSSAMCLLLPGWSWWYCENFVFWFLSAFNTTQPLLLSETLLWM